MGESCKCQSNSVLKRPTSVYIYFVPFINLYFNQFYVKGIAYVYVKVWLDVVPVVSHHRKLA